MGGIGFLGVVRLDSCGSRRNCRGGRSRWTQCRSCCRRSGLGRCRCGRLCGGSCRLRGGRLCRLCSRTGKVRNLRQRFRFGCRGIRLSRLRWCDGNRLGGSCRGCFRRCLGRRFGRFFRGRLRRCLRWRFRRSVRRFFGGHLRRCFLFNFRGSGRGRITWLCGKYCAGYHAKQHYSNQQQAPYVLVFHSFCPLLRAFLLS